MQSISLSFIRLFHKIRCEPALSPIEKSAKVSRMPHTKKELEEMQLKRQEKRKMLSNFINGTASLKVLGTGALGTTTNLSLLTSHSSYIFNCGEGFQKLSFEHRQRMSKLEHIFITSATWKNLGGLPGMLLTIQEMGIPPIYLHGPKGTIDIIKSFKTFISMDSLKVEEFEKEVYTDKIITIKHVQILRSNMENYEEKKVFELNEQLLSGTMLHESMNSYKKIGVVDMHRIKKPKMEINNHRITEVMCYICKLADQQGKLCLEKCLQRGIQPGPTLGQLKSGQDITLPDGTLIKSSEVCEPSIEGPTFMVVECPTEDYLESFVNHEAFVNHQIDTASQEKDVPRYIYHFTPQHIMENPKYKEWMKKYGPATSHIILNESNNCTGQVAVYEQQNLMHLLHPEIFPMLEEEHFKDYMNEGVQKKSESSEDDLQIYNVKTLHTVHILPRVQVDTNVKLTFNPETFIDTIKRTTHFDEHLPEMNQKIQNVMSTIHDQEYPRIVMLGTGSSIPNKVRNTSGILVRIDKDHSILLDCGEGTIGQLYRLYGKSQFDHILASIKAIYVSHLHADHHMGLFSIIRARQKVTDDEIYFLVPEPLYEWISLYNTRFEPITKGCILMTNGFFNQSSKKFNIRTSPTAKSLLRSLNLLDLSTCLVRHCPFAYGIRLTLFDGKSIVYSGDTMPSTILERVGKNCDLLIHEATFDDNLVDQARLKNHSTTSQAISVAKAMDAKFILLTHFSQRYCKLPILSDDVAKSGKVGIAYDFMDISLSKLPILPLLYPVLKIIYAVSYSKILKEQEAEHLMQCSNNQNKSVEN